MSSGQPVYLVQESPSVSVRFIDLRLRVLVCFALRPNTNSTQKLLHRTVVVFSLLVAQLKVRVEDVSTLRLPCGHECCVGEAPTGHFLLRWCEEPELKAFATLRWGEPIQDLGAFGCAYCGPSRYCVCVCVRACVCVCACVRACQLLYATHQMESPFASECLQTFSRQGRAPRVKTPTTS
jgi:hypothetical protein